MRANPRFIADGRALSETCRVHGVPHSSYIVTKSRSRSHAEQALCIIVLTTVLVSHERSGKHGVVNIIEPN